MNDSFKLIFLGNYLDNLRNHYEKIKYIHKKVDYNDSFLDIINLFFEFIRISSSFSNQIFPTNFSRWIFLNELYKIPDFDEKFIRKLQTLKRKIKSKKIIENDTFDLIFLQISKYSVSVLAGLKNKDIIITELPEIAEINGIQNNSTAEISEVKEDLVAYSIEDNKVAELKGILKEKKIKKGFKDIHVFVCLNEVIGKFYIILDKTYSDLFDNAGLNATLNFINIDIFDLEKKVFKISERSIIVYEPDYLFDITELSECFTMKGVNPATYFLKLFSENKNSMPLIKGTLVNTIFDELIVNPNIDFETCFHKAIKQRPLRLLPLLNKQNSEVLKVELENHFSSIAYNIPKLPYGIQLIEPTFISNLYGIQGRLDLLVESKEDENLKEVIELKSGKSPSGMIRFGEGFQKLFLNSWVGHAAQANGYNLLLESVFPDRTGSSSIFYSSDILNGYRNVPNIFEIKKQIIDLRNAIYIYIQKILAGNADVINIILNREFTDNLQNDLKEKLLQKIRKLEKSERHYLTSAVKFILKEEITSKLGNNTNSNGQSHLWNNTLEEKTEKYSILIGLEIDEKSDFDLMHLYLKFDLTQDNINFFRKGDQCLIYPQEKSEDPSKFYIIKGFIREITTEYIIFSLLNKSIDRNIIKRYSNWIIETDYSDSLIKKQYAIVSKFFDSEKDNRELLHGQRAPKLAEKHDTHFEYLNEHQNLIANQAINASEYFLIQGPPGTGKTSRLIRAIADYTFIATEKKVLLCAYTNRAVDEICETLDKIQPNFPFIRISGKELENFAERSLPYYSSKLTISGLKKHINSTRFFVSTVSSLQTNPEIFDLINFDLLILDEASQVLETQIIGILSQVDKFIMIGDEKQLPAIVLQETNEDELLKKNFHLHSFSESLFQRLIRICKINKWDDVIATLTNQGRMHTQIQNLSNFLVYENQLSTFDSEWQNAEFSRWYDPSNEILKRIFDKRVTFINSPLTEGSKINLWEVKTLNKIINEIFRTNQDHFNEKTLGVISPFRLQCRTIINELPIEIRNQVTVDTVERFQGSERDIIIISFATNFEYLLANIINEIEIDGTNIDRKLNVAITRAKEHLIILGNEKILSKSKIYASAIDWIKENGTFIDSVAHRGIEPLLPT